MFSKKEKSNIGTEFIGLCYENNVKKESLEMIFEEAKQAGQLDLIFNAVDAESNKPYQKAAKHGNAEALEWIV